MSAIGYYICQRFFTKDAPNYSEDYKPRPREIVSLDCGLFPYSERKDFTDKSTLRENEQIVAVFQVEQDGELPCLDDFEFCGFDLVESDSEVSALTNCPEFSDFIARHVSPNTYGLLDKREDAETLQKLLPKYFPNEEHADCRIYCIWRKV